MQKYLSVKLPRFVYLIPLAILCLFFFINSLSFRLHDFLNSYLPAVMVHEEIPPESILFNIYDFNQYTWNKGMDGELLDFYLNSPFNATAFYPLVYLGSPFWAKVVFNVLGIILFLLAIYSLARHYQMERHWVLLLLPLVFYVPIRNQIYFGQSYFLVFALVVFAYLLILKKRELPGAGLLGLAALIKIFPVFYGIPLLANLRWRAIVAGIAVTALLFLFSIYHAGYSFWETYLFEVVPNAIQNGTTIDFRANSQSLDVFFKNMFVFDPYYNPGAPVPSERSYLLLNWMIKSIVLGLALYLSYIKRKQLMHLLAIWVVVMFLLQSKTATYAQIMWIIPLFYLFALGVQQRIVVLFLIVLFAVCNFPYHYLLELPIGIRFLRLWLTLFLGILFYRSITKKIDPKYILMAFVLTLPLNLKAFKPIAVQESNYVIEKKTHFMIGDFDVENGKLVYTAIGRSGPERVKTTIAISSFEPKACTIKNNQVYLNGEQITSTKSTKKKAVLINGCEVYFLSDHRSRPGAFTLKKTTTCEK